MKRSKPTPPPAGYVGDHADRLSRIPGHRHDPDDDRPSREDRKSLTSTVFQIPVEVPKWLRPKRER